MSDVERAGGTIVIESAEETIVIDSASTAKNELDPEIEVEKRVGAVAVIGVLASFVGRT